MHNFLDKYRYNKKLIPGVKHLIVVSSSKGGVGKSTVCSNIALSLSKFGRKVGVVDADVYGPSQAHIFNVKDKIERNDFSQMKPHFSYGIQVLSLGQELQENNFVDWRGPMVSSMIEQLIRDTEWDVDCLVVDMPPGTGDICITLLNNMPIDGAVIVTTPQDISLIDVKKGISMFQNYKIKIYGVIENMSMHICSKCGNIEHIFGENGGKKISEQFEVPFLGSLPLNKDICETSDNGSPIVFSNPDHKISKMYDEIANKINEQLIERELQEQKLRKEIEDHYFEMSRESK